MVTWNNMTLFLALLKTEPGERIMRPTFGCGPGPGHGLPPRGIANPASSRHINPPPRLTPTPARTSRLRHPFTLNAEIAMKTFHSEVTEFLSAQPLKMSIGGRWVEAASRQTFETRDPGNGTVLARVSAGDHIDVGRAVEAGAEAFRQSGWATLPANDRAVILHRLADLIVKRQEIIAQIESLDVGKPYGQALGFDVPFAAQAFRYYADLSVHTRRREPIAVPGFDAHTFRAPYGVCGFICPWNFPFLLVGWGVAPALAAGNTVVIKPAEDTPLSTLYFDRLAAGAGVPAGGLNCVA